MTPGPDRCPLSIVQVGSGFWGRAWAEVVHRTAGFRLAAVVDGAAPARAWAEAELRVPTFESLDAALRAVAADAVLLVSPPSRTRSRRCEPRWRDRGLG